MNSSIRIYYRIRNFGYLSKLNDEGKPIQPTDDAEESLEESVSEKSLNDAISAYRKVKEGKRDLSDKEMTVLEQECKVIENREIIEINPVHEPQEIEVTGKGKIQMGPPTLTRFEKARIMGARALQLSLGAPPFIEIPETATTSLNIAMEELEQRVIPITIRRTLPNGDYQNIPIDYFI